MTYEIVEKILRLRAALEPRGHALGAVVQQGCKVPGCRGNLPDIYPEPWDVAEKHRDAVRAYLTSDKSSLVGESAPKT